MIVTGGKYEGTSVRFLGTPELREIIYHFRPGRLLFGAITGELRRRYWVQRRQRRRGLSGTFRGRIDRWR
jgi:hypothetical protein